MPCRMAGVFFVMARRTLASTSWISSDPGYRTFRFGGSIGSSSPSRKVSGSNGETQGLSSRLSKAAR